VPGTEDDGRIEPPEAGGVDSFGFLGRRPEPDGTLLPPSRFVAPLDPEKK